MQKGMQPHPISSARTISDGVPHSRKQQDHLPKTCQEVSDDAKINAVHQVEGAFFSRFREHEAESLSNFPVCTVTEAMSSALIRKCPKCSEPYIKENDSCNKITCGSCRTMSCYMFVDLLPMVRGSACVSSS